jgi:hypothetical protein
VFYITFFFSWYENRATKLHPHLHTFYLLCHGDCTNLGARATPAPLLSAQCRHVAQKKIWKHQLSLRSFICGCGTTLWLSWGLHLTYGITAITNRFLELGMLHFMQRYIINYCKCRVRCVNNLKTWRQCETMFYQGSIMLFEMLLIEVTKINGLLHCIQLVVYFIVRITVSKEVQWKLGPIRLSLGFLVLRSSTEFRDFHPSITFIQV